MHMRRFYINRNQKIHLLWVKQYFFPFLKLPLCKEMFKLTKFGKKIFTEIIWYLVPTRALRDPPFYFLGLFGCLLVVM